MVCTLRNLLACETKYTSHITSATGDTQRRKLSPSSMFAGPKSLGLLSRHGAETGQWRVHRDVSYFSANRNQVSHSPIELHGYRCDINYSFKIEHTFL